MITEIRRLEHAIQATEIPTHIARDCLGNRQRRIDTDLVQDDAENQLLKVSKDLVQLSRRLNFFVTIMMFMYCCIPINILLEYRSFS